MEQIKKHIIEEYKKGNIVVATFEGLQIMSLQNFLEQPIEGMLYDINRDEGTILTFIENNPKWINDYALTKVVRYLKEKLDEINKIQ